MRGKTIGGLVAAGALLAGIGATSAGAATSSGGANRFGQHRAVKQDDISTRLRELLATPRTVKVVVQVAGPSVAEAKGDALDRGAILSPAESAAVRTAASHAQDGVVAQVQARGGRVERRLQDAINAVTAVVPASQVDALRAAPGVVAVTPVSTLHHDNANSNAFTGVPAVWTSPGVTGKGVKVAVIDDGIDYTHADFGGAGTPAAYTSNNRAVIEPGSFPTPKVVAGYDFVGDAYDADSDTPANTEPRPDPDPLACGEHGTHVSGTTAGAGVLSTGATYAGPYTQAAVNAASFNVSPGSAPEASLMAYKVFGCEGSVTDDIVVAAIDRAVADGAQVINMSLGQTFGRADEPSAIAADNAVRAGTVVVASAGNEGPNAYTTGSPATSKRTLSVAALDALPSFPGAKVGGSITAINANNGPLPVTGPIYVVRTSSGALSLGCEAADYAGMPAGAIAVVVRGTCDRVAKPLLAQAAGAAATIMVNSTEGLPPFEGNVPGLTTPFLGVSSTDSAAVTALNGQSVTITSAGIIANPGYKAPATFTSGGPRFGDSGQKPDVIAPGVSVASAAVGTGTSSLNLSGTSMSSPHTAGIAALVVQAHPDWRAEFIKAAMVNTADPSKLAEYDSRISGSGVINPAGAVATTAVALAGEAEASVNFTFNQLNGALDLTRKVSLVNRGSGPTTFRLASQFNGDSHGAVVSVTPSSVTVPKGGRADVNVRIRLSKAAVAALPSADPEPNVTTVRGIVTATPTSGPALRVPFILTPAGLSNVKADKDKGQLRVSNDGIHSGTADVYAWLLSDKVDRKASADLRAVGAQVFDAGSASPVAGDKLVVLDISLNERFSNAGQSVYEFLVDTNKDGKADYDIIGADLGFILSGVPDGQFGSLALNLATGDGGVFSASAPVNGTTVQLPVLASDLGMSQASSRLTILSSISYSLISRGGDDEITGKATFDAWNPQVLTGQFAELAPGAKATLPLAARPTVSGEVPALGWMVVSPDDAAGDNEADLIRL